MGSRLMLLAGLVVLSADPADAQWTESRGAGWFQVATYSHRTSTRYDERGAKTDLFNEGGRSATTSLFVTGVIGIREGLDFWAQVPVHRLVFNDVVEERRSTGVGDPRIHLRFGHKLTGLDLGNWAAALRVGVKFKGGEFPIDSEIIPLTEGQRDAEIILELGRSFWPRPLYATLWLGYRWRAENKPVRRRPGNERFLQATVGGSNSGWNWKLSVEAMDGDPSEIFGISIPSSRRDFLQILPSIGRKVGPGGLEVGVRLPVSGRNLPAGTAWFLGYFSRFNL
jgi:hypothetical protein